jgi:hypothetical protein
MFDECFNELTDHIIQNGGNYQEWWVGFASSEEVMSVKAERWPEIQDLKIVLCNYPIALKLVDVLESKGLKSDTRIGDNAGNGVVIFRLNGIVGRSFL